MRLRCLDPRDQQYPWYGARGIRVCDEWRESFDAFLRDVGPRPSPSHSLDRIENDGNYEPGNVRWATKQEQALNTRRNVWLRLGDQVRLLADWSLAVRISPATLRARVLRGWTDEEVLTTPIGSRRRYLEARGGG
jgi:hypothetical protein